METGRHVSPSNVWVRAKASLSRSAGKGTDEKREPLHSGRVLSSRRERTQPLLVATAASLLALSPSDLPLQTASAWPLIRLPVQGGCVHYRRIHPVWCGTPPNPSSRRPESPRESVPFNNYIDKSRQSSRERLTNNTTYSEIAETRARKCRPFHELFLRNCAKLRGFGTHVSPIEPLARQTFRGESCRETMIHKRAT